MAFLLLFLCFIMGCCSSSLIKYVSNLIASSSSSSLIEYVSNLMASSSSHDPAQRKYEVFISFRGSDVRRGFLSHLKNALRQKQIDVYEDERLQRGDEISSSLLHAIEASGISLIIFSKDYADSKWCLEELVKIMECKELIGQTVIPVFYYIDPSDVRHQKGTYEDAFAQHEQKLKDNKEKVQNWRSSLNKAANLSGRHYLSNSEKDESEFIDEIVKDVLKKNDDIYPYKSKGLVGIEENFAHIKSLLEIESKEVRIIGIWGMGGVGKTTLAHAVCDKFCSQFERSCFLENVREESEKSNGLNYLLEKLFSVLLEEENLRMNDVVKVGSCRRRLSRRKVFIVLDDVDISQQLKDLVGEPDWLGQGSKVIVTSRDKHVLISGGVHKIHEIKGLNFEKSLELFSLNAFKESHPQMGYEEVSKMVVTYADGIPLALKVLGSHFNSRNMEMWQSELERLKMYPNMQIQNVLRVSYDGLDDGLKDIFLDIAFFFKGKKKDDIIRVLDAFGTSEIGYLVEKALITISSDNRIEMHDLIQEMGEQIVRKECIENPGERSRLKDSKEIYDVLKNNMGTKAVKGIILDMSQITYIELTSNSFREMSNLKYLEFYNGYKSYIQVPSSLESFSDKLRYFRWDGYPLKSLPLTFCAEKLVEFHMEDSNLIKLWEGVQDLLNLKSINLSGSRCLLELPDFSKAQKLERVCLTFCDSLCNVHPSILSLHSLVTLNLSGCKELKSLQSEIHLKSLENLDVFLCSSLQEFSLSSEKLTTLRLFSPTIEIMGSSIGRLSKLRSLWLNGSELRILPINDLCCLTCLQELFLFDCGQVIDKGKQRILFDSLHSLEELHLIQYGDVYELPDNISAMSCLRILHLSESNIESLPASIKLPSLEELHLEGCSNLSELPDNISGLSSLKVLSLVGSSIESLPASIKHLSYLERIELSNCEKLRFLPELPPFITNLDAYNCTSLETVLTSTTFALQQDAKMHYFISLENCKTLDGPSLIKFVRFWVKRIVYNNARSLYICYPGNRVPEWFGYQQIGTTITNELASPLDDLKGFILCFVPFPCFSEAEIVRYELHCQCYFGDGEEVEALEVWTYSFWRSKSDNVFIWYEPLEYEDILEEVKRRRGNDEGITYNPKLSFKFFLGSTPGSLFFDNDLIKECGVHPIYASENHNLLEQMELKMKTKRQRDNDEQQQLPPAKRFLHGIFHPLQLKFLHRMKEKRSIETHFL